MSNDYQDIWIYTNVRGKIVEVPAYISKAKPMKLSFAIVAFDRDNNTFVGEIAKEPGMIFNNSVWFKSKNFDKAKDLFMNEYGEKINKLYSDLREAKDEMVFLTKQEEV